MKNIILQKNPINISEAIDNAGTNSDGAILSFIGRARDLSNNKNVNFLEYEIYESMAKIELEKIVDEAMRKWPINDCVVFHRYGRVEIGEVSIVITVTSPHRDDSYQASRYIIDTIKKTVPIWKKEFYKDGSQWISDRS